MSYWLHFWLLVFNSAFSSLWIWYYGANTHPQVHFQRSSKDEQRPLPSVMNFLLQIFILAIPFSTMVVILLLWFGITTPLTFLGAFYGYKKRAIEHPVRTNTIPRTIPEQIFYTKPLPGIVMGGILPFGCIFIQLFFIMNSIWSHQVSPSFI